MSLHHWMEYQNDTSSITTKGIRSERTNIPTPVLVQISYPLTLSFGVMVAETNASVVVLPARQSIDMTPL